jgi:hypothetical protein
VLVGPIDRGVDAEVPLDLASGVGQRNQVSVDPVPGPVSAEPLVTLPHRLPRTELSRQVTPGDPGAEPVDDPLQDLPVIPEGPMPPVPDRHQRLDLGPMSIAENCYA